MVDTSYLPALGCANRSEGGGYSGPVIGLSSVTRARRTQARRTRATDCYPATFVSVTRKTSPSSGYGKQGSRILTTPSSSGPVLGPGCLGAW